MNPELWLYETIYMQVSYGPSSKDGTRNANYDSLRHNQRNKQSMYISPTNLQIDAPKHLLGMLGSNCCVHITGSFFNQTKESKSVLFLTLALLRPYYTVNLNFGLKN
jgi:hypothetical protein